MINVCYLVTDFSETQLLSDVIDRCWQRLLQEYQKYQMVLEEHCKEELGQHLLSFQQALVSGFTHTNSSTCKIQLETLNLEQYCQLSTSSPQSTLLCLQHLQLLVQHCDNPEWLSQTDFI